MTHGGMGVPALTSPYGQGRGIQEPFAIANPGAATAASFVCDGRGLRRLLSLVFTITTDANVANRYVTVEYQDSAGVAFVVNGAGVVVTAGSTQRYSGQIGRGNAEWATGTDVLFPLESVFLNPGDTLKIAVASMQAGDTLTVIRGVMERFPLDWYDLPEREG